MIIGTVKGSVWATKKDERLNGCKFMIVQTQNGSLIATDSIGAGIGDSVLVCLGSSARIAADSPVDAAIIGIVDSLETD